MTDASSNVDLSALLERRMAYLNQRAEVLAQNVANADTPGYKQQDLVPMNFGDALKQASISMDVTNPKHIIPASLAGVAPTVKAASIETLPDGNSVDIEQQMMEVSKNAVDYQGITSIYHAIGNMFLTALKGNSSS
jgi:flagellar basal-body rod protein FlgB